MYYIFILYLHSYLLTNYIAYIDSFQQANDTAQSTIFDNITNDRVNPESVITNENQMDWDTVDTASKLTPLRPTSLTVKETLHIGEYVTESSIGEHISSL